MDELLQALGITLLVLGGLVILFWIYVIWYVRKALLNLIKVAIEAWNRTK
jgi:hypothetical protein